MTTDRQPRAFHPAVMTPAAELPDTDDVRSPHATAGIGDLVVTLDTTRLLQCGDIGWLAELLQQHGTLEPGDVPLEQWVAHRWVSSEVAAHLVWARQAWGAWLLFDAASSLRWAAAHRPLLLADVAARLPRSSWWAVSTPGPPPQA